MVFKLRTLHHLINNNDKLKSESAKTLTHPQKKKMDDGNGTVLGDNSLVSKHKLSKNIHITPLSGLCLR